MVQRCIMIFPKFQNIVIIEEIRKQNDPLHNLVEPHISLVFPFHSDISKEQLKAHIVNELKGIRPFKLKMKGISGEDGGYLFLNVFEGEEEIFEIHTRLYRGILEQHKPEFLNKTDYLPHMTVGRIAINEEMIKVVRKFKTLNENFEELVREISVEIIGEDEESIIEMTIEFEE